MSRNDQSTRPLSLDTPLDEDRIRRALGLGDSSHPQIRPEQARQRHRFVSDGAIPVVTVNRSEPETSSLRERLGKLEGQLEAERTAHAAAKRALSELQVAHHALQTRLQHNEMAAADALAAAHAARERAEAELAETRRPVVAEAPVVMESEEAVKEAAPARRGRKPREETPAVAAEEEQEPVRWWEPSYRAKRQRR